MVFSVFIGIKKKKLFSIPTCKNLYQCFCWLMNSHSFFFKSTNFRFARCCEAKTSIWFTGSTDLTSWTLRRTSSYSLTPWTGCSRIIRSNDCYLVRFVYSSSFALGFPVGRLNVVQGPLINYLKISVQQRMKKTTRCYWSGWRVLVDHWKVWFNHHFFAFVGSLPNFLN